MIKKFADDLSEAGMCEFVSDKDIKSALKECSGYYGSPGYVSTYALQEKIPIMIMNVEV